MCTAGRQACLEDMGSGSACSVSWGGEAWLRAVRCLIHAPLSNCFDLRAEAVTPNEYYVYMYKFKQDLGVWKAILSILAPFCHQPMTCQSPAPQDKSIRKRQDEPRGERRHSHSR